MFLFFTNSKRIDQPIEVIDAVEIDDEFAFGAAAVCFDADLGTEVVAEFALEVCVHCGSSCRLWCALYNTGLLGSLGLCFELPDRPLFFGSFDRKLNACLAGRHGEQGFAMTCAELVH